MLVKPHRRMVTVLVKRTNALTSSTVWSAMCVDSVTCVPYPVSYAMSAQLPMQLPPIPAARWQLPAPRLPPSRPRRSPDAIPFRDTTRSSEADGVTGAEPPRTKMLCAARDRARHQRVEHALPEAFPLGGSHKALILQRGQLTHGARRVTAQAGATTRAVTPRITRRGCIDPRGSASTQRPIQSHRPCARQATRLAVSTAPAAAAAPATAAALIPTSSRW